jgi:alanyl-tRNA synthetase
MIRLARLKNQYLRKDISKEDAVAFFSNKGDEYKLELIEKRGDESLTLYTQGEFTDLCKGPHLPDTGYIKAVKLTSIAGAYWRGDEKNKQLTRIYGITFPKNSELTEYLEKVEEAKRRVKTIRSAVSRTVNMMEAVLSSNLLKTGKMDVYIELFSLKELVIQLCQEQADLARSHEITVDVEKLPDVMMLDKKILTLVLTNLLANAVKYTPNDKPVISVSSRIDKDDLIIEIQDNGVGIPESEINKIFERYYRASTSAGIQGSMHPTCGIQAAPHQLLLGAGNESEIRKPAVQAAGSASGRNEWWPVV